MKQITKILFFTMLAVFALPFIGNSQIVYYTFSETSGNTYNSIAATGTSVTLTDDSDSQENIGFNFDFNGVTYTQVKIGSNGWFRLGTNSATSGTSNIGVYGEAIAPFFDDLNPTSYGSIYFETLGVAPNRTFIVEYDSVQRYGSSNAGVTLCAQAVLYEGSNNIEFRYGTSVGVFQGGSIGISEAPLGANHIMSVTPGTPSTVSNTSVNSTITAVPANGVNYLFTYTAPACPPPSNQLVTNISYSGAQLNWESGGSINYDIEYGIDGFTRGTGTLVSVVTDTFLVLTNLTSEEDYEWYVRDSCGTNDASIWIGSNSFTTPPSCPAPTNLLVTSIATTSAQLNWTSGGSNNYNIEYGVEGFARGTGTILNVVTDTFVALTGLISGTSYEWYIQDSCGTGDVSAWITGGVFVTNCDAVTSFPYTEDFDGIWYGNPAAPLCWSVINADGDSYKWSQASTYITPTHSGTKAAHGMGNTDDYLISPLMTIGAGTEVVWWDKVESSAKVNTYDVLLSTTGNDTASFTINLGTIDCSNESWTEHSFDLSAYSGSSIYIAFHQTASASSYYGFGIDDFKVRMIPQNEVEVSGIIGEYGGFNASATDTVKVIVKNNGALVQTALPIKYNLNGAVVSETMTTLAAFTTDTFEFATTYDASVGGEYILSAYTDLSGDENNSNDTSYLTFETRAQNDLGVIALISPESSICGDAASSVKVVVKNFGVASQSNVPVNVIITNANGTSVTLIIFG